MSSPLSLDAESSITAHFQLNAARILQSVAPPLAAVRVKRARSLYPATCTSLAMSHCVACSAFLLDGTGSTRIVRRRKKSKKDGKGSSRPPRAIRLTCNICGHVEDTPVVQTKDEPSPSVHKTPATSTEPSKPSLPITRISTPSLNTSSPQSRSSPPLQSDRRPLLVNPALEPSLLSRPKARPKKSSGLQDMLARNKQREEQAGKKQSTGLSSFLQGL